MADSIISQSIRVSGVVREVGLLRVNLRSGQGLI